MAKIIISEELRDYLSKRLTQVDDAVIQAAIVISKPESDGSVIIRKQDVERIFDAISFGIADFVQQNRDWERVRL